MPRRSISSRANWWIRTVRQVTAATDAELVVPPDVSEMPL